MKTLLLTLCLIASACTPRTVVVDPIAPKAVVVAEKVRRASASAAAIQTSVTQAHKEASGLAAEAERIRIETERLSHLAVLQQSDWDAIKVMNESHARNAWAHEITTAASDRQSTVLQKDIADAGKEADELVPQAKATDKQTAEQAVKNAVLEKDADKWNTLKKIVIGSVILLVAYFAFRLLR